MRSPETIFTAASPDVAIAVSDLQTRAASRGPEASGVAQVSAAAVGGGNELGKGLSRSDLTATTTFII